MGGQAPGGQGAQVGRRRLRHAGEAALQLLDPGALPGDAAVVVGGRENASYVTALRRLATNALWRDQLIGRGVERARQFRWVETARKTAEVYRRLAGETGKGKRER